MKTTNEIRQAFLDFFKSKGHTVEKSSALVPQDDPTLLFTTAGMVQFKPYFARIVTPPYLKATTSQKCLRAGGQGSDLENVGRTSRHHTFFEMLGNFSFGDYFKRDAIVWAWEFVTQVIKLPKDKLWASVYLDDAEAFELWQKEAGLPAERIVKLGKKDNFWGPAGDSGACGPCSEIYIDRGPSHARVGWEGVPCTNPDCKPGCDCDRYLEFWNLVFMQFFQEPDGSQRPLPHKGIDTGMGLERLALIVQDVETVYDTDAFVKILDAIWAATAGDAPKQRPAKLPRAQQIALNCVADHVRALTFAIADGAMPSNEGRGYVLRRILRRAVRFAKAISLDQPFMFNLVATVVAQYGEQYPELKKQREHIASTIHEEETKFHSTLRNGMNVLMEYIEELKAKKGTTLSGDNAFKLHATYGFPFDLTKEMLEEKGLEVDEKKFKELVEEHAGDSAGDMFSTAGTIGFGIDLDAAKKLAGPFVGYEYDHTRHVLETDSKIAVLAPPDEAGQVRFALDPTPFYAEGGGQAADHGTVSADDFEIQVHDVRRVGDIILHRGRVARGGDALKKLAKPAPVKAKVDRDHRLRTARHHTATHLLQAALRHNLGPHIQQAGSQVTSERFRFDFSHPKAIGGEVLHAIEDEVNSKIMENLKLENREMSFKDAVAAGALAFFGEKYGDKVRVVKIGDYSTELCGGTHVAATGEIGLFAITSESGISAGTRRVEVVCGTEARGHVAKMAEELSDVSRTLKVPQGQLAKKVESLLQQEKDLAKKVKQLQEKLASGAGAAAATEVQKIDGISLITQDLGEVDMDVCRNNADRLLKTLGSGLVVVGSRAGDKACLVAKVSGDLAGKKLKAGDIVKRIAATVGGSGGGRPDMAQAGGNQPENLAKALSQVPEVVKTLLAGQA